MAKSYRNIAKRLSAITNSPITMQYIFAQKSIIFENLILNLLFSLTSRRFLKGEEQHKDKKTDFRFVVNNKNGHDIVIVTTIDTINLSDTKLCLDPLTACVPSGKC